MFVDTLKCAFVGLGDPSTGQKELFTGLYLENHWNWNENYPVIRIGFEKDTESQKSVIKYIRKNILKNAKSYGIRLEKDEEASMMIDLVEGLANKYNSKVVILIDEYDKPILDNIENKQEAERIRETLKEFYSVLKGLDQYLKFVFITGITKFAKISLFRGLGPRFVD